MKKEESLLQNRFFDLANVAYTRDIVTFTDFLNLNELNILHHIDKEQLPCAFAPFGGYDFAERQMVAFLPDALCYEYEYPIYAIKISAMNQRYAEILTHRDYLGAILNLGIHRGKIGDLLVLSDKMECYAIVHKEIAPYILENLTKIKHTFVACTKVALADFHYEPQRKEISGNVASIRLDNLISLSFGLSRSKCIPYIEGKCVFVNGRLVTSNGYRMNELDIVSVRKLGKFQYIKTNSKTKKGRLYVTIEKYI